MSKLKNITAPPSISCCQWSQYKLVRWLDKLLIQDQHNRSSVQLWTDWNSLQQTKNVQTSIPAANHSRILERKYSYRLTSQCQWAGLLLILFVSHGRMCNDTHHRSFWEVQGRRTSVLWKHWHHNSAGACATHWLWKTRCTRYLANVFHLYKMKIFWMIWNCKYHLEMYKSIYINDPMENGYHGLSIVQQFASTKLLWFGLT